jgi:CheY-like chemotaxis protein
MAMVHGIISDHHGSVWIESRLGDGTAVHCLLPAGDAEESTGTDSGFLTRGGGERILVIDDEPQIAVSSRRRLESFGYRAFDTSSPEQALELFRSQPMQFDLIFTDFSMPVLNGIDLARAVRAIRPDIPVVLVTGHLDVVAHEELEAAGIRWVARKPLSKLELAAVVSSALRGEPA